ncbi:MAG: hypothetical protein JSU89_07055 [Myxococcales bacterium]|nr:MAG: hypothetical protein JSU89_07055 [Myxococcales bacterium]
MRHLALGISALVFVVVASVGDASAQEGAGDTAKELAAPREQLSYDEYRRNELEYLAKRSRTALISTSAVAAVGIALVAPALVRECVRITSSASFDDLRCTSTGQVLLGVGYPILIGGVTGVLVTAIMLGVRKGKIRGLNDRIAYEESRAVRWDPARSMFVF